jgi:hypothetical protein
LLPLAPSYSLWLSFTLSYYHYTHRRIIPSLSPCGHSIGHHRHTFLVPFRNTLAQLTSSSPMGRPSSPGHPRRSG